MTDYVVFRRLIATWPMYVTIFMANEQLEVNSWPISVGIRCMFIEIGGVNGIGKLSDGCEN